MRVKHTAKFEMKLVTGRRVLEKAIVSPDEIDGQKTVWSFMYEGGWNGISLWRHPITSESIRNPKIKIKLLDLNDELIGDQLCDCQKCLLSLD